MLRRSRWLTTATSLAFLLFPLSADLFAQGAGIAARPGGYLSLVKLGVIALIFIIWVFMADWINKDMLQIGDKTKMKPEVWNPMIAFSFLAGFMAVLYIPIFLAGFPLFCVAALLPPMIFFLVRRGKVKAKPSIKNQLKAKKKDPGAPPPAEVLPQDEGIDIEFTPAGEDKNERQANLIRARQSSFTEMKELINKAQFKRAEQILLDYTRDSVSVRILVDGAWHAFDPMDRELGDSILVAFKNLAGLNPAERRTRQNGKFKIKSELGKAELHVTSQGVPTGERVQIRFGGGARKLMNLNQLGMFPDMVATVKKSLDNPGVTIISSPPGSGLTSSWQGTLATADRLTRDCVGIVDEEGSETAIENIVIHIYDQSDPEKAQYDTCRQLLLTQPDMLAVPKIEDAKTLDLLCEQTLSQERALVLMTPAKTAAEALLRMYAQASDREKFLTALHNVTCQRLVRRLCDACKVEVQVQPQVIQKLGGNPKVQNTIYNQWQLPPPEQRVDEKGKEIEFPPCETCGGIGYIGRIAIFELISLNDKLRKQIKANPKIDAVEAAAVQNGKATLAQQAYKLVLLGVTSIAEVQTVLKQQSAPAAAPNDQKRIAGGASTGQKKLTNQTEQKRLTSES